MAGEYKQWFLPDMLNRRGFVDLNYPVVFFLLSAIGLVGVFVFRYFSGHNVAWQWYLAAAVAAPPTLLMMIVIVNIWRDYRRRIGKKDKSVGNIPD